MALINRQVYVNDGGGRSTSTTTKPKSSTGSTQNKKVTTNNTNAYYSSSVNPNYNYSVSSSKSTSAPKTTTNQALAEARQRFAQKTAEIAKNPVPVVQQPVARLGTTAQTNPPTPRIKGADTPQILNNWTATPVTNNNNNDNNNGNNYTPKTYQAPAFVEAEPTYSAPVATSNNTSTVTQEQKNVDDTVDKIKELLEEQKRQADAYYKTMYEQQLSSDKEEWENARNQINRNYVRTNRYLNNMYGDAISGVGLSNRARNYANWNNNLSENQRNYDNNVASALAQYNNNLANTANTLSQGWYNYVLPIYSNREQNANNMDYQRWAYEQNLNNRRQMNLDDLDYRKYLATLGLR